MPKFLFYNDEWLPDDQPLIAAGNRGFRYGDGLFETLCVADRSIRLPRYHFDRLPEGLELLQLRLPAHFTPAYLSDRIIELCDRNNHPDARVRLTVFRGDGNLFDAPGHTAPGCIIESQALPPGHPALTPAPEGEGRRAGAPPSGGGGGITSIFTAARKSADAFSHLKSNNYLASVLGALYARENGLGDVFLLNAEGRVCESTIANVFILRQGRILTPSLAEGCVAGVMRRFMLEQLPALGYAVEQGPLPVSDLLAADEVFLTNALRLLWPVTRCDGREYGSRHSAAIAAALREKWVHTAQLSG